MKTLLKVALAWVILAAPGIAHAKGSAMEIKATVESFTIVGDSLEIVFQGTMSHVSGDVTDGDQWGFSARVKKTKLVIPDRKLAYFFTRENEVMRTRNLKDDFELGEKIYGQKGKIIWISAYDPIVCFDDSISKITSGSVCFAMLEDTMSNTAPVSKSAEAAGDTDEQSNKKIETGDQISTNHKKLIGSWKVLHNPKRPSPASGRPVTILDFSEDEHTSKTGRRGQETDLDISGPNKYELDESKSPMWITLQKSGEMKHDKKGIFRFVGEELQILWPIFPSNDRPVNFDENESNLFHLIRATKVEAAPKAKPGP